MPGRLQAEGTGDGCHETDEADDNDAEAAPAPPSPSPSRSPQAPSSPPLAAPPSQAPGDMMMDLLKQVWHKTTCFEDTEAVHMCP